MISPSKRGAILLALTLCALGTSAGAEPPPDSRRERLRRHLDAESQALQKTCGASSLDEITQLTTLSDACKRALQAVLPGATSSLRRRTFLFGAERKAEHLRLFFNVTDIRARSREALKQGKLSVELYAGTQRLELKTQTWNIAPLATGDPLLVSMGALLDYSGSMSDADVDHSVALFRGLYGAIRPEPHLESNVVLFSSRVRPKLDFSQKRSELLAAVKRDPTMERGATALLDGMGHTLERLKARPGAVRLLAVTTDGRENASRRYTEAQVVELAQQHGIRVLFFGTLLSDLKMLARVAEATGGLFVFNPSIEQLTRDSEKVRALFSGLRVLDLRDPAVAKADRAILSYGSSRSEIALTR